MWRLQWKWLFWLSILFLFCFYLPVGIPRFNNALLESLELVKWYAREHVLLCLVPALFIAGAIGVFINQASVLRYLGPQANKLLAYLVAAISGGILALCSCTILPLFAGVHKRGAGLGPASAFLYSGPAINIMAITLSARILGFELGLARAIAAITMSIVIGISMQFLFRREEQENKLENESEIEENRPLWQTLLFIGSMIAILVFANWSKPDEQNGIWAFIWAAKWYLTATSGALLAFMLTKYYGMKLWKVVSIAVPVIMLAIIFPNKPLLAFSAAFLGLGFFTSTDEDTELNGWFEISWDFTKKIMPLLLLGIMIAGLLLGRVGHEGLIPSQWVESAVGSNSLTANFFAAFAGAFMYFATLTEVPILEGLIGAGMGKGPALTLLLAGPALSLPSMLVINEVIGFKKTAAFVSLVVIFSTICGYVFGSF